MNTPSPKELYESQTTEYLEKTQIRLSGEVTAEANRAKGIISQILEERRINESQEVDKESRPCWGACDSSCWKKCINYLW